MSANWVCMKGDEYNISQVHRNNTEPPAMDSLKMMNAVFEDEL